MEIKCPSCRKCNIFVEKDGDNRLCKRCGGDLSKLFVIAQTAAHKINIAKDLLLNRNPEPALILAEESWRLKHSIEAARLAFIASVAKKNYTLAYAWYLRSNNKPQTIDIRH